MQHTFVIYPGNDVLAFCLLSDSEAGKLWICDNTLRAKKCTEINNKNIKFYIKYY